MNYNISMFIDNEMNVDDKIDFIETMQKDKSFTDEVLELLHQEKLIQSDVVEHIPSAKVMTPFSWKRFFSPFFQPMGLVTSALAATVIYLFLTVPSPIPSPVVKRFVVYKPNVSQVEITGSFTEWERVPMQKIGNSGYWEVTYELKEGEHRFTYLIEGQQPFADPTILTREPDDFGGENSIFYVKNKI
ncbi:glycogen-binding domain-containing protein [Thermodesulfobacteriota bacterium]